MKTILTLSFLLLLNSSWSQQTYETIDINGTNREYYQYLPANYDPQTEELPLVFLLHGLGGNALNTSTYGMNPIADTGRFIMIYPQGLQNFQSQNSWNNGTLLASDGEDLLFLSRIIDSVNSQQNIDLSRVYMSGISMGSIMTYNACRYMSDRIAAAVCMIGTMSTVDLGNYNPVYPVPILHKHGTDDATVPYDSGALPSLSLVPETIEKLKDVNGWQGDSTITTLPDLASDGITVDRIVYNCTTPLELWRMNNADHVLLFQPLNDTTSTVMTWAFFQQFTHPNPSAAGNDELAIVQPIIYPNPVNDELNIENFDVFQSLAIMSIDGKVVREIKIEQSTIDLSTIEAGNYVLRFVDIHGQSTSKQIVVE